MYSLFKKWMLFPLMLPHNSSCLWGAYAGMLTRGVTLRHMAQQSARACAQHEGSVSSKARLPWPVCFYCFGYVGVFHVKAFEPPISPWPWVVHVCACVARGLGRGQLSFRPWCKQYNDFIKWERLKPMGHVTLHLLKNNQHPFGCPWCARNEKAKVATLQ